MTLGRWFFCPAVIGSKRRRFCDLLSEVERCLAVTREDYEFAADNVGQNDGWTPPPVDSHERFADLRIRLEMLFPRLKRLGVPVPDAVQVDRLGDLTDMVGYLAQLKRCMRACDLGAARKIDPP